MIYPFHCPSCGNYREVVRPVSESGDAERCNCGQIMNRVYTIPQINVSKMDYFNYGLGVHVKSKDDVKNAIKKIADGEVNGRTVWHRDEKGKLYSEKVDVPGRELVEIGNEKVKLSPKKQNYDLPRGILSELKH